MSTLDDRTILLREVDRIIQDNKNGAELTLAELNVLRVFVRRFPRTAIERRVELESVLGTFPGAARTLNLTVEEAKTLRTVLENALTLEMENGDNGLIGCEYRAVEGVLRKLKELEG